MQHRVEHELSDADGCLLVLNAEQGLGPGDRFIAGLLKPAAQSGSVSVAIAVNKVDRADRTRTAETLHAADELGLGGEIFPVSARTGAGVPALTEHLVVDASVRSDVLRRRQRSDQSRAVHLAELVREQVLSRTREEVPHAVEVEVSEISQPREDLIRIEAVVLSETESQKGILIGSGGRMIKSIGVAARRNIERELGCKVHLELSVSVRRHWRADERVLDRLGIE